MSTPTTKFTARDANHLCSFHSAHQNKTHGKTQGKAKGKTYNKLQSESRALPLKNEASESSSLFSTALAHEARLESDKSHVHGLQNIYGIAATLIAEQTLALVLYRDRGEEVIFIKGASIEESQRILQKQALPFLKMIQPLQARTNLHYQLCGLMNQIVLQRKDTIFESSRAAVGAKEYTTYRSELSSSSPLAGAGTSMERSKLPMHQRSRHQGSGHHENRYGDSYRSALMNQNQVSSEEVSSGIEELTTRPKTCSSDRLSAIFSDSSPSKQSFTHDASDAMQQMTVWKPSELHGHAKRNCRAQQHALQQSNQDDRKVQVLQKCDVENQEDKKTSVKALHRDKSHKIAGYTGTNPKSGTLSDYARKETSSEVVDYRAYSGAARTSSFAIVERAYSISAGTRDIFSLKTRSIAREDEVSSLPLVGSYSYGQVPYALRSSIDIAMRYKGSDSSVYRVSHDEVKESDALWSSFISIHHLNMLYAPTRVLQNVEIARHFISQKMPTFFYFLTQEQKCNLQLAIELISLNWENIQDIPDVIREKYEFALFAVEHNPLSYKYLPEAMRANKEIAMRAVAASAHAIVYVPAALRDSLDFTQSLSALDPTFIPFCSDRVKAITALYEVIPEDKRMHSVLKYAPYELKRNYVTKQIIVQHAKAVDRKWLNRYVKQQVDLIKPSTYIKGKLGAKLIYNGVMVSGGISEWGQYIPLLPTEILRDVHFLKKVLPHFPSYAQYFLPHYSDEASLRFIASCVIDENPEFILQLPRSLQVEHAIVFAALKALPQLIFALPYECRCNRELALLVVKKNAALYRYLDVTVKSDVDVALIAVQKEPENALFIDSTLRKNKEIALCIATTYPEGITLFSSTLLSDIDIATALYTSHPNMLKYIAPDTLLQLMERIKKRK